MYHICRCFDFIIDNIIKLIKSKGGKNEKKSLDRISNFNATIVFSKKQEVKVVENNNKIIIKIKNYKYNYNI